MVKELGLCLTLDAHVGCRQVNLAANAKGDAQGGKSLLVWEQDNLGFIAALPPGTLPPGIKRRRRKGGERPFAII